jgi:hypothetical protein
MGLCLKVLAEVTLAAPTTSCFRPHLLAAGTNMTINGSNLHRRRDGEAQQRRIGLRP